jgi:NADP-dependent aldehyde dehydrogenase
LNQALGPVVVFGASNFPLAFSVAGGDTASALAAGCSVLVKGHSSHPGTSELVAQAMARAAQTCRLPVGVFSLLMGEGAEVGSALVQAPEVKAVGFTGSFAGGMALFRLANARAEPIPVFAEMGSINPVCLLPGALKASAASLAKQFVASLTMGTGQFCVNPGLVVAVDGPELNDFVAATAKELSEIGAGVMLNERICNAYVDGLKRYSAVDGVKLLAQGQAINVTDGYRAQASLLGTTAENFIQHHAIHEEIFGPVSLLVRCRDESERLQVLQCLGGQLTGTIHCAPGELEGYAELVELLTRKVGRVVINGFPTGVEVCPSMVHGGPFPASTDSRFTSVGTAAIFRFQRAVCYQNFPETLLPDALKNSNPLNLVRTVNGTPTKASV